MLYVFFVLIIAFLYEVDTYVFEYSCSFLCVGYQCKIFYGYYFAFPYYGVQNKI